MKALRAVLLLLPLLSGCCEPHWDPKKHLCGSSEDSLLVYDPCTDQIAWLDKKTLKVIVKYEHWNKWWNRERNQ